MSVFISRRPIDRDRQTDRPAFACLWALGVRLGLFPPDVSCFFALRVRLGLFPPVFASLWAIGVRLGLFPPVCSCYWAHGSPLGFGCSCCFMSLGPRGSFGFVSSCFCMSLGPWGPCGFVSPCFFEPLGPRGSFGLGVFVFSCAFSGDCVAPRTAVLCLSLDIFSKDCNFTCASIPQRNRESITFRIYSDGRMLSVYVCV